MAAEETTPRSQRYSYPTEDCSSSQQCSEPAASVEEQQVCGICQLVLEDAQPTSCCGKIYCKACIEPWLQGSVSGCPCCNKLTSNQHKDLHSLPWSKRILIYCIHRQQGCSWEGEFQDLAAHIKSETGCQYVAVECPFKHVGCAHLGGILRKDLEQHMIESNQQHLLMVYRAFQQAQVRASSAESRLEAVEQRVEVLELELELAENSLAELSTQVKETEDRAELAEDRWRGAEERLQRMVSSEGAGVENLELELEVEEVKKSSKSSPPLPSQPTTHKEPEERWQKNGTSVEEAASTRPTNLSRPSTASRSYSQHSKEYYSDHPKSGTVPSYRGTEPRSRYLKPKTGTYNSKSEPRTHPQKFRETRWHSRNAVNGDNSNESSSTLKHKDAVESSSSLRKRVLEEGEAQDRMRLFVKYMPHQMSRSEANDLFAQYGKIFLLEYHTEHRDKVYLIMDKEGGERTMEALDGVQLKGSPRPLSVQPFIVRSAAGMDGKNLRLFVKPVPLSMNIDDLIAKFTVHGNVYKVAQHPMRRNIYFVVMNPEGAKKAMAALNGTQLSTHSRPLIVDVSHDITM